MPPEPADLVEVAWAFCACDPDDEFEFGLDLLILGPDRSSAPVARARELDVIR